MNGGKLTDLLTTDYMKKSELPKIRLALISRLSLAILFWKVKFHFRKTTYISEPLQFGKTPKLRYVPTALKSLYIDGDYVMGAGIKLYNTKTKKFNTDGKLF